MRGEVVCVRAALDETDDLVGRGIDDVVDIAGVVALEDPHGHAVVRVEARHALSGGRKSTEHQSKHDSGDWTDGYPRHQGPLLQVVRGENNTGSAVIAPSRRLPSAGSVCRILLPRRLPSAVCRLPVAGCRSSASASKPLRRDLAEPAEEPASEGGPDMMSCCVPRGNRHM